MVTSIMKSRPLAFTFYRRALNRHWTQAQQRKFYHHCNQQNDCDQNNGVLTTTIPKMGRGIRVGQYATMTRTYNSDDVERFGKLIRDLNPLHSPTSSENRRKGTSSSENNLDDIDEDLFDLQTSVLESAGLIRFKNASNEHNTGYTKEVVHGMFVASSFSSIFATIAPGCVYINQSLDFCSPVFVDDTIVASIKVERIRDWRRRKGGVVVQCHTRVHKVVSTKNSWDYPVDAQLSVKGCANVWLPIGCTDLN